MYKETRSLEDILLETADALVCPTFDNKDRDAHIAMIEAVLQAGGLHIDLPPLLCRAIATFKRHMQASPIELIVGEDQGHMELASKLLDRVQPERRYLYHGTIRGHLRSISEDGLRPNKNPVWSGHVAPDHLKAGVFFDTSWRGAASWAAVAQYKATGPEDSEHREPAVLRVRAAHLIVEQDRQATKPGCVFVRGCVPVDDADCHWGLQTGIPNWQPIRLVNLIRK